MTRHVGVALSGGGHRATLWGLGALLYLVDAGKNEEVAAVSSVSGGSIANGVVAHEVDLGTVRPADFERRMAPLVRHVAEVGLFFWGPSTNPYVLSVLAGAAVGGLALLAGVVVVLRDGLTWTAGVLLLVAAAVLALTARRFERRSEVVDRALARTHFRRDGRPTPLAAVDKSVDHVFCATELQSADHLYLSPRFVSSYALGLGEPANLRLSTAVQASACLPGAFAPRRLPTGPHRFTGGARAGGAREMVLVDGGVYDNMADQWLDGLAARLRRTPALPARGTDVDEVVLVNASAATEWTGVRKLPVVLLSELATLKRVSSVMYQVTTERRRQALVAAWTRATAGGDGQRGALVHIAQSPYLVADRWRGSCDRGRAARSEAVLALLGDTAEGRQRWAARAASSRAVPTVLRKLGPAVTVDLLEHAYLLAMCNLHVLLGYPLLEGPVRERVARLLAAGAPAGSGEGAGRTGAPAAG